MRLVTKRTRPQAIENIENLLKAAPDIPLLISSGVHKNIGRLDAAAIKNVRTITTMTANCAVKCLLRLKHLRNTSNIVNFVASSAAASIT